MLSSPRILVVVFAVSVAISLAWQYHAAQGGAVDSGTADQVAALDEAGGETAAHDLQDNDSKVSTRHPRGAASGDAKAKNKERAGEESRTAVPRHEETYIFEYDEGWVGQLQTRLFSPDPLLSNEPDALPVISGRVLTPNGRPVEGVEVTAEFRNYSAAATGYTHNNAPLPRKTRTNHDGFYAFTDLPAGIYMLGIGASAQFSAARMEVHTGINNADLVLDPQQLVSVRGMVTDPMGGELEHVRIMPLVPGLPKGVVSNKNGEFSLGVGLENPARHFALRLQLDGYREQRYEVTEADWTKDGGIQLALTMEPAFQYATVSGSVTGPDGAQIVGDYVRLYSPSLQRNFKARVDGAGEFLFDNVEIANDYQLWMRPTGPYRDFTQKNFAVGPGSMRKDIVLQPLDRSHRLTGRILDISGNPVPNFTLTLRSLAATAQKLSVTSNGFGEFELDEVPQGDLVFESRARPYHKISGLHVDGVYTERNVDLVINRGTHKLLGKVISDSGRPIAAPRISLTATTIKDGMRSSLSSATSADAKGRFVFTDLGSGKHTITVHAPGYESIQVQPDIDSHSELVIKLQRKKS